MVFPISSKWKHVCTNQIYANEACILVSMQWSGLEMFRRVDIEIDRWQINILTTTRQFDWRFWVRLHSDMTLCPSQRACLHYMSTTWHMTWYCLSTWSAGRDWLPLLTPAPAPVSSVRHSQPRGLRLAQEDTGRQHSDNIVTLSPITIIWMRQLTYRHIHIQTASSLHCHLS